MWGWLLAACALECALLLVPGSLLLRALGMGRTDSLCLAPAVSLALFGLAGVAYAAAGTPATALTVAGPLVLLAVAFWALRRHQGKCGTGEPADDASLRLPALYVGVGSLATLVVLVASLGEPTSFIQTWDNVCHFNLIRSLVDSRSWSTLAATYYPGASAAIDPFAGSLGYYPSGWHILGALLVDALGVPVTLAANAVNAVVTSVVWPLGMCALMRRLFAGSPRVVACGAVCCCAFPSFPWNLIERWTLYPNLLAFALLPTALAAFLTLAGSGVGRSGRVRAAVALALSGVSLVLAQPNAAFSAVLFVVPWCTWRVWRWRFARRGLAHALVCVAAVVCLALSAWVALSLAPFLSGVVQFFWRPMIRPDQALLGIVGGSFIGGAAQPLLALLLVAGAAACWRRGLRWLLAAFALASGAFFVAATGADTALKHLVSGFWYTDPYRLGATGAIFAVPIASVGLAWLAEAAGRVVASAEKRLARSPHHREPHGSHSRAALVPAAIIACFALATLAPPALVSCGLTSAQGLGDLGWLAHGIAKRSDTRGRFGYSEDKMAFVERVRELVGPDAVVLNEPYDGSVYAYGVSDLNVMWRYMSDYGAASERAESVALRRGLAEHAGTGSRAEDARAALAATGAEYLMRLGGTPTGDRPYFSPYEYDDWEGVLDVTDDTPGFELVLAEDNMRLYRIVR